MIITPLKTTTTFSISSHDRVKKKKKGKFLVVQLCSTLRDHMDYIARQAPLSMGFSRQEYWSGLLCPSPGDLPNPRIKPGSPTLQEDSLLSEPLGKPHGRVKTLANPLTQK